MSDQLLGVAGQLGGLDPGQGRELFGGPGHPDPEHLQPGGVALGAHRGSGQIAEPAAELAAGLLLGHRATAAGAAGQGAAVGAGQQPGPALPVEDAHHPTRRDVEDRPQQLDQALGEQPGARIVGGPVDHFDHRPSPTFDRPVGGDQPAGFQEGHRRAGRHQHHRRPVPSAALDGHVDRRPGGRALLPIRLVVGIEHHHRGDPREWGPGGGPGPDHHPLPRRRRFPFVGEQGHRRPGPAESVDQQGRPGMGRRQHQHPGRPPPVDQLEGNQRGVEGGGQPHHRLRGDTVEGLGDDAHRRTSRGRHRVRLRGARHRGWREAVRVPVPFLTTRGGDAVPRNDDSGPAHRQDAHSARATTRGGGPSPLDRAIGLGSTPAGGTTSSSTTQAPTRRPWRSMRTRLPTRMDGDRGSGTV